MTFSVAIIGRPNVGKSTLFNRLVGKKLALVDDRPGVTRDRREGEARLADLTFTIIDTAGLEQSDAASLTGRMRAQTEAAIEAADAVFFVIDARAGVTPTDRHFAELVRRADKPIIVIANKAEGKQGEAGALDAYELGLGEPVPLSAEHGDGFGSLYEALLAALPEETAAPAEVEEDEGPRLVLDDEEDGTELDVTKPLRIAVVGRPNAGKSTLINRILGEERLLTGPEAGITRDSIGVDFTWAAPQGPRTMRLWDTAGLRRRANVQDKLEKLAAADAIRAVRFAEVVVVLLDATIPFEKQDLTIADLVEREGRALVFAPQQMGPRRRPAQQAAGIARGGRSPSAAIARLAGCAGLRPHGRGAREADGRHRARPRGVEQAHLDGQAQSLADVGGRAHAAARRVGTAHQDPLHDAAEGAAAVLHPVRQPAHLAAHELRAFSRARPARNIRAARRADPHLQAHEREPLRGQGEQAQVSAGGRLRACKRAIAPPEIAVAAPLTDMQGRDAGAIAPAPRTRSPPS